MTNRKKEIAKFFCGVEAFHVWLHAWLLLSGTTLTALGITTTPTLNIVGIIVNAGIAVALGLYAWKPSRLPAGQRPISQSNME